MSLYEHFIDEAKKVITQDGRFIGLLSGGSMKEGTMDRFSDLDLVLVYDARYRDALMSERISFAESLGPLLSGFTGEHVGEPRLVICLYGPPALHVDLKFITLAELEHRIENPLILWERDSEITQVFERTLPSYPGLDMQWIEDRFWVWVHYGATKLGRGELFELVDHITFIRGAVLGPLLAKLRGHPSRGVRKLEGIAGKELEELVRTIPHYTAESCFQALQTSIQLYKSMRSRFPDVLIREEAEIVSMAYLSDVFASRNQCSPTIP